MDPLTLFALANGAVSAVKAGCKLYKDIKGAAGEVKEIIKDLDDQFNKVYDGKQIPLEAKVQLAEEKQRVRELAKKDPGDVYTEIGQQLGVYFENRAKCIAIWKEEERRAGEVYSGESSVGKRALDRVLMRKKLEQMEVDLRELMVYQSPTELGSLYEDVFAMMTKITAEQSVAIAKQMQKDRAEAIRKKQRMEALYIEIALGIGALILAVAIGIIFSLVVEDRIKKYPQYGTGWIPRTEEHRKREAEPHVYVGR
jgi:hypothetical protein